MKINLLKNKLFINKQKKLKKHAGRNNQGNITVRHQGGGNKRLYKTFFYDVNGYITFGFYNSYNKNNNFINVSSIKNSNKSLQNTLSIELKNHGILDYIENNWKSLDSYDIGQIINNIELYKNKGAKLARAAGSYGQILDFIENKALVKCPSNKKILINKKCHALQNSTQVNKKKKKKAGQSRWLNIRPTVRGVAMNPVDHPHGGGEGKTSGGRPSVSPWGWLTKGKKTKK